MELPDERPATYQDIFDLPEAMLGEIINGQLVTHPRLTAKALIAKEQLGGVLANHFGHIASAQTSPDGEQHA
jgi:hypothetical protein